MDLFFSVFFIKQIGFVYAFVQDMKVKPYQKGNKLVISFKITGIPVQVPNRWLFNNFKDTGYLFMQYFNSEYYRKQKICHFELKCVNQLVEENIKIKIFINSVKTSSPHIILRNANEVDKMKNDR